uniref:Probable serine/threonine-protein kinase PIX13 isoform X2 n=1 Tax=Cicer arietinum TaxID=3827 RepID=A0A3Q7X7Q7_CICAR|nr:probable serine/threonine-protein kinase PIX13 isoform X2 [Cicer arietinum]
MPNLMFSISLIGGLEKFQCILLKTLLVLLSTTVFLVDCGAYDRMLEASLFSSVTPIPSRAPSHSSITPMHSISHAVPSLMAHPPLSPYVSNCCKKGMVLKRGSEGCHCVYPVKLDLLLLNVSQNPDWNIFLDELAALLGLRATQIELINFYVLGLSTLNISMYITPQKEISFSANEASKLNSSLLFHKVRLDSRFVGDYRVLNMTWFKPLPPSQEKPKIEHAVSSAVSLPRPTSTRFISYEDLREATNNFESASILGEGGFGKVFKGVLNDGTAVAIKRLTSGGHQGDKEFLVEVDMLSRLHHRNLVKLVGYYSNRDSSQNLLCYELVPNGSLETWLHGPLGVNCPLDWDTRMKIALDAARGLAYLHEDSQPCVIHRDFKASNILLENNFHAKVADFGLAKQAPEGRANYLSTRVMGTFGYVAPEYAMTGHLLVKSDVYSYGVVLLELLTGRKPVDMSQPTGQENLVTWARPILRDKERLEELADPRLGGKYPKEDFLRVCTIAAACVAPEANQRPTMGEVVQSLKMVQRVTENHDTTLPSSNTMPNMRQFSTTYESDGTSSMFSSGPYSGLSPFDYDNISRTAVFSEDLHEGR